MKRFNSQDDITHYTAQDTGLTYEQVKLIERNFWSSIRYFMSNPLLTKKGILISESLKIYPRKKNLYMAMTRSRQEVLKQIYGEWYKQAGYEDLSKRPSEFDAGEEE